MRLRAYDIVSPGMETKRVCPELFNDSINFYLNQIPAVIDNDKQPRPGVIADYLSFA